MTRRRILHVDERAADAFDAHMHEVLAAVRPATVDLPNNPSAALADLHVATQLSDDSIDINRLRIQPEDHKGNRTACYFYVAGEMAGIEGEGHAQLLRTAERIAHQREYRDAISTEFVYARAIDWIQARVAKQPDVPERFTKYLEPLAKIAARKHEVWFPLPIVLVDVEFKIADVTFRRISKTMMDDLAERAHAARSPEQQFAFNERRSRLQGATAACVELCAEPIRAREIGAEAVEFALAILRLACPAILSSYQWAPIHADLFDVDWGGQTLRVEDGRIVESQSGLHPRLFARWLITPDALTTHTRRIWRFGDELLQSIRNEFQGHLLSALLQYSKSVLTPNVSERLLYIVSALETLFIASSSEPILQNLRERMAILKPPPAEERITFTRVISEVYEQRSAFVHRSVGVEDIQRLEMFFVEAWSIFVFVLQRHRTWQSKAEFIAALDRHKLSASAFGTP